jgi:rubrerythrin
MACGKKNKMLSDLPRNFEKVPKEKIDAEILRAAIIAELDAINLYEQMASLTQDDALKKILLDVAKEEKTHVGEFQALLLEKDKEQVKELEEGKKEVEEILEK